MYDVGEMFDVMRRQANKGTNVMQHLKRARRREKHSLGSTSPVANTTIKTGQCPSTYKFIFMLDAWNSLPDVWAIASSVKSIEHRLDRFWADQEGTFYFT